jgi:thymidylate synthase
MLTIPYRTLEPKSYLSFTECYEDLIHEVMLRPDYECSPRGLAIKEKIGVSFCIDDPRNRLLYIPERNFSLSYTIAEATWYFAGRNDIEWIATYSPFWLDVADDGKTANSSYGSRIFRKHDKIDNGSHIQYDRVLEELKTDPDSRRAVMYLTQPSDHYTAKKDIGCATNLQFFIRDGYLHQIANMRSSDLILGIPYDVTAFTLIQEMLALDLGVKLGTYMHNSSSLHIYDRNFEVAQAVIDSNPSCKRRLYDVPMPVMSTRPNADMLIEFEGKCRTASSAEDMTKLYETVESTVSDEYWRDWLRIFVMHKSKKLNKPLKNQILSTFNFEGFRQFKK